jgi:glycosyltransferase involved in cell wall biosynthesis
MLRVTRPARPVIFLLNSLTLGGSESKTIRMANALAERGTRVTVAYLNPPEQLKAEIAPGIPTAHLRRRGKFSPVALRALIRTIREHTTPVVVTVNLYPALYGALARTLMGRNSFRLLMTVNTTEFPTRAMERRMPFYRRVLARADTVVFGAETQRRLWQERYGVAREQTRGPDSIVLYNGVDTEHFANCEPVSHPVQRQLQTRYVIGTVGRMRPEKSQVDLVRVTAELRSRGIDVGALIVGDGPERAHVLGEIERLNMGKAVVLAGETRDVRPLLGLMDVFVLPSIGIETFSNAALEAMACGLPVVCSRVGGMEELISHGGGVSFPPGNVNAMADLLQSLLQNEVERRRMALAARRAAVEHFGWDRMVDRFLALASAQ